MPNTREKGSRKKTFVIVIGILVLFAGVGVYAFQAYILNHPIVKYAEAEKETINRLNQMLHKYTGNQEELAKRLLKEKSETNSVITADLDINSNQIDPVITLIRGILGTSEININSIQDPATLESKVDVNLNMQGASLFNIGLYQNREITAIDSPIIYDQPIGIHNKRFGELIGQPDEPTIIEEFPNFIEIQNQSMTPKELRELYIEYLTFIGYELKDLNFELNENVKYEGKKYTQYSLHISEDKAKNLLKKILTKMNEDKKLKHYLFSPLVVLEEDNPLEQLLAEVDLLEFPGGITYEAYYNNNFVQYRNLNTSISANGETVNIQLSFNTVITKNDEYDLLFDFIVDTSDQTYFIFKYDSSGEPIDKDYHVKRRISLGYEDIYESGTINFDYNTVYQENIAESDFRLFADINDPSFPEISGHLNHEIRMDGNEGSQLLDFSIGIGTLNETTNNNETYSVTFNIDQQFKFGDAVTIPKMNHENILFIDELDEDNLYDLENEISDFISSYYENLFGKFSPF
ncbi:hypothetical protein ACLIA0_04245 [Bacillaceae bacterium W0354]